MVATNHRALAVASVAFVTALAPAAALGAPSPPGTSAPTSTPTAAARKLLDSHELWATIDVCKLATATQTDTVGIRGSMPGDGRARDKMYMSFRLQYLDSASDTWIDVVRGSTPAFVAVGAGTSSRQGGTSFQLAAVAGKPAVTLRGVVDFQWRRGSKIVLSAARPTSAGHKALAGAEPAGYNAATCLSG